MRATTKLKGRGIELFDSNSPAANSAEYAFRFVDRLTVSGELLTLGISNFTKPRISKRAQREAQKILTAFTSELPVFFHNLDVTPASPSPQKQDQYHCITETCPKGVACTTIDVEQQKVDLLAKLKTFRKYNNQTFRWANSVKVFGAKVARLRKEYDRDEAELKQLIEEIPNSLVVIDVTVPIK
jgi:hypothetical protein